MGQKETTSYKFLDPCRGWEMKGLALPAVFSDVAGRALSFCCLLAAQELQIQKEETVGGGILSEFLFPEDPDHHVTINLGKTCSISFFSSQRTCGWRWIQCLLND